MRHQARPTRCFSRMFVSTRPVSTRRFNEHSVAPSGGFPAEQGTSMSCTSTASGNGHEPTAASVQVSPYRPSSSPPSPFCSLPDCAQSSSRGCAPQQQQICTAAAEQQQQLCAEQQQGVYSTAAAAAAAAIVHCTRLAAIVHRAAAADRAHSELQQQFCTAAVAAEQRQQQACTAAASVRSGHISRDERKLVPPLTSLPSCPTSCPTGASVFGALGIGAHTCARSLRTSQHHLSTCE